MYERERVNLVQSHIHFKYSNVNINVMRLATYAKFKCRGVTSGHNVVGYKGIAHSAQCPKTFGC